MGFGMKVKVEVPKVDVAGAVDGVKDAVSGVVDSATSAVSDAVDSAKDAVNSAVDATTDAVNDVKESLSSVAGAIADVAVSFTGAIEDIALEPHLQLDANASFGKTNFEKGPIWIRIEDTPEKANTNNDLMHLYSGSGEYDTTVKVAEFTKIVGNTVVLLFKDAPMNETYSLEVIRADGSRKSIFASVAYGDLRRTKQQFI